MLGLLDLRRWRLARSLEKLALLVQTMLGLLDLRRGCLVCLICENCARLAHEARFARSDHAWFACFASIGTFFGRLWKRNPAKKKNTLEITNKFTSSMILPKADFKGDFEIFLGGPKFHLNF